MPDTTAYAYLRTFDLKDTLYKDDDRVAGVSGKDFKGEDPLRKFLLYRACKDDTDADACPVAMTVEKLLLENIGFSNVEIVGTEGKKRGYLKFSDAQENDVVGTDTCYSSLPILQRIMQDNDLTETMNDFLQEARQKLNPGHQYIEGIEDIKEKHPTGLKLQCSILQPCYVDKIVETLDKGLAGDPKKLNLKKALIRYVSLTHTLGNIVLVPEGYNVKKYRSYRENISRLVNGLEEDGGFGWWCPNDHCKSSDEREKELDRRIVFGTCFARPDKTRPEQDFDFRAAATTEITSELLNSVSDMIEERNDKLAERFISQDELEDILSA